MSNIIKNKSAWYYRTDFFIYKIYYFFFRRIYVRMFSPLHRILFSSKRLVRKPFSAPIKYIYNEDESSSEWNGIRSDRKFLHRNLLKVDKDAKISILRQRRVRSSSSFVYLFLKTFSILRVISMMQGGGRKRRNPRWKVSVYPNERNLEEATNKRE